MQSSDRADQPDVGHTPNGHCLRRSTRVVALRNAIFPPLPPSHKERRGGAAEYHSRIPLLRMIQVYHGFIEKGPNSV